MRPIAFLPSTDLERSRQFFADTVGLEVLDLTPFACVLASDGMMVRVTLVSELTPQPFTVFGWAVDDLRSEMDRLRRAGVGLRRYDGLEQDADGIWTTPGGDRIVWFADPDGNVLSLTQFA